MILLTVSGREMLPPGSRNFVFRRSWARPGGESIDALLPRGSVPSWQSVNGTLASPGGRPREQAGFVDRHNPRRYWVRRPNQAARVTVTCNFRHESASVDIWFIEADIELRSSERDRLTTSPENPNWDNPLRYVGIPTNPIPNLGLQTWLDRDENRAYDGTHRIVGRGYGALIEIMGTVRPAGVVSL